MVTTGRDSLLRVWDLRKLTPLATWKLPTEAVALDIS